MAGIPIIAAATDEEAEFLATSLYQRFLSLIRGQLKPTPPPVASMDLLWTTREKSHVESMMKLLIVGGPETVKRKLEAFLEVTRVDELIITSDVFDQSKRLESYKIISEVAKANGRRIVS